MKRLVLAILVVVSFASAAGATPVFELYGAANAPHPFAPRVLGSGAATAYFNPALLPTQPKRFELNFLATFGLLDIGYDARPASADITEAIYDARMITDEGTARIERPRIPTEQLRRARGSADPGQTDLFLGLGNTTPILEGRLAFGMVALFPLKRFQAHRPFFNDEREQSFSNSLHFELYGDRLEMAGFVFALGGRPVEWLGLGVGVTLWTATVPTTSIYIPDATNQEDSEINSTTEISFRVTPHFGLVVEPWRGLRVTATTHLASSSSVKGDTDIQFWTYPYPEGQDSLVHDFDFTYGFLPLRVSLGLAWEQAAEEEGLGWSVGAELLWAQWSRYRDRHGDRPEPGWRDTVTLGLAGEVVVDGHRIGLDLLWAQSPVPAPEGRRNYVDNERLGAALAWEKSWPVGAVALGAGLQFQVQRLLPRHVDKEPGAIPDAFPDSVDVVTGEAIAASAGLQTNNPGYPGFSSEGWLLSLGAGFHVDF